MTAASPRPASLSRSIVISLNRWMYWLARHWLLTVSLVLLIYVGLPFLAPVFMSLGLTSPGRVIYFIYSWLCHQLPQRSYFLFGPHVSYPPDQIQAAWKPTTDLFQLRRFTGNEAMGWKVAWSDRMVWMYTTIPVFGWVWYALRRKLPALPVWGVALFFLPMAVDGFSHFFSDLNGIGQGYRDANLWLVALTGARLPAWFYAGDAWGSFNAWMRAFTGLSFGMGLAWFIYPLLEEFFTDLADRLRYKFARAGLPLER